MLSSKNLNDKSYEEFITEAIAQIPLYSREWTNFNPSDPGITILENFSAFSALQRSTINEVPEYIKLQLLKLAGFTLNTGVAAKAYLRRKDGRKAVSAELPGQKVYADKLCFEYPVEKENVNTNIVAIIATRDGNEIDYSDLLEENERAEGFEILGERPAGGEQLDFYLDEIPEKLQELLFYIEAEEGERNSFDVGNQNIFAKTEWLLYTEEGFVELSVEDETGNFLKSGIIHIFLEQSKARPAKEAQSGNYLIRAKMKRCDYDVPPRVRAVRGALSQVVQKDTHSVLQEYQEKDAAFEMKHELLKNGMFLLFQKTEKGYLKLEQTADSEETENSFESIRTGEYAYHITLQQSKSDQQIMALIYEEQMLPFLRVGTLLGFDQQEFDLPPWDRAYGKEFSVLVQEQREGRKYFHVITPEQGEQTGFFYRIDEEHRKLIVTDCGTYEGSELLLGTFVTYAGDAGNVRKDTVFKASNDGNIVYVSVKEEKGNYQETLEELTSRFTEDVMTQATAVTKEDYEKLVRGIPGLSIRKIKAQDVPDKNEVHLTFIPGSQEKFPRISDTYIHEVEDYFWNRRMVTTKIVIKQPLYVPIAVHAVIHIKKYISDGEEKIRQVLDEKLDGIHSEQNFGENIYFHDIFQAVSALDCVDKVLELTLFPENQGGTLQKGFNIQLNENALCYPGEYHLEINAE